MSKYEIPETTPILLMIYVIGNLSLVIKYNGIPVSVTSHEHNLSIENESRVNSCKIFIPLYELTSKYFLNDEGFIR